jgi:hypothetical protein
MTLMGVCRPKLLSGSGFGLQSSIRKYTWNEVEWLLTTSFAVTPL